MEKTLFDFYILLKVCYPSDEAYPEGSCAWNLH